MDIPAKVSHQRMDIPAKVSHQRIDIPAKVNHQQMDIPAKVSHQRMDIPAKVSHDRNSSTQLEAEEYNEITSYKETSAPPEKTTSATTIAESITTTTTLKQKYITPDTRPDQLEKSCQGKEADVVFLVDMSSSILEEDFEEQLYFLSDLIRNFDIDSGKTKVGMLMFSDDADVEFYLDDFNTVEEVRKAILAVKSEGGKTNTHRALQKLQDEMLTKQHGFRPGVAHICILITDGRSTSPGLTLSQAKRVHKTGTYVFAIGVGNMTDTSELRMMASSPEYAFEVNGYKALKQIKNILAYKTCEVPQADQPRCTKLEQADVSFGLYGIGGHNRQNVGKFIESVGSAFDFQSGNVRFGLREGCGEALLKLRKFQDGSEWNSSVSNAMNTDLSSLLFKIRQGFGFTRRNTERIAILLISGSVQDIDAAYEQARYLKFKARVIVVGMGEGLNTDQLKRLASYRDKFEPDISHVFPVPDSSILPLIVKKLQKLMCNE